jgi:hypothetical protein
LKSRPHKWTSKRLGISQGYGLIPCFYCSVKGHGGFCRLEFNASIRVAIAFIAFKIDRSYSGTIIYCDDPEF